MGKLLKSADFLKLLEKTDRDLAAAAWREGCLVCGARLHVGDYPRKPRGTPMNWDKAVSPTSNHASPIAKPDIHRVNCVLRSRILWDESYRSCSAAIRT